MTPTLYIVIACALSLVMFLSAFEVKPVDRVLVDAYGRACRALGYGRKEIAAFQGLNESQWKRQLNAEPGQHVSAYRVCRSPEDVMRQTIAELAPIYRRRVVDERDLLLPLIADARSLVESNRELLKAVGVVNDWNRQARMALFVGAEKETA